MTLLQQLCEEVVHFAFMLDGSANAFLSELELEELVPLLEEWCAKQRELQIAEDGCVH